MIDCLRLIALELTLYCMTTSTVANLTNLVNYYASVVLTSGQSYKHLTIVNYDFRVVIWPIL